MLAPAVMEDGVFFVLHDEEVLPKNQGKGMQVCGNLFASAEN